jgi:hypothetical protein
MEPVEQPLWQSVTLKMLAVLVGKTTQPQQEQKFVVAVAVERQGRLGLVRLAVPGITLEPARVLEVVAAVLMVEHLLALREPQHLAAQEVMELQARVRVLAELQLQQQQQEL